MILVGFCTLEGQFHCFQGFKMGSWWITMLRCRFDGRGFLGMPTPCRPDGASLAGIILLCPWARACGTSKIAACAVSFSARDRFVGNAYGGTRVTVTPESPNRFLRRESPKAASDRLLLNDTTLSDLVTWIPHEVTLNVERTIPIQPTNPGIARCWTPGEGGGEKSWHGLEGRRFAFQGSLLTDRTMKSGAKGMPNE